MKTKMLVVVDMQNDFIDGSLGTKEAQAIVKNVAKKIEEYKNNGDEVYFTRDTHFKDYLKTQEGKNLPVEHCILKTKGWEISSELGYVNDYHVYNKYTFGCMRLFEDVKLSTNKYDEIELVGLCTDICVVSNALGIKSALEGRDTVVSVDASCCAGVTPEAHDHAIAVMKSCQIKIKNEGKEPWRE